MRADKLDEYSAYLGDRDGDSNIQERLLSKREAMIAKHEAPPTATAPMDEVEFRRQYNKQVIAGEWNLGEPSLDIYCPGPFSVERMR